MTFTLELKEKAEDGNLLIYYKHLDDQVDRHLEVGSQAFYIKLKKRRDGFLATILVMRKQQNRPHASRPVVLETGREDYA
ncbi:hypothetical protein [Metabacillus sp. SLBN-84]